MQPLGIQFGNMVGKAALTGVNSSVGGGGFAPAMGTGVLLARTANPFQFQPGQNLFGMVTGRNEDGSFNLRFGNTTMQANSGSELNVGQPLNVTVSNQQQNGTVVLNVATTPFSSLDNQAVGQTLAKMNVPLTEGNLSLANSMLEHGLPLDKATFQSTQKALAQLPPAPNTTVANARIGATCFLQANQLPLTSQNITSLSNFIATNPQLGQQLFNLQNELRQLKIDSNNKLSSRSLEILEKVPGLLGELTAEPSGGVKGSGSSKGRGMSKALFDSAKQAGIETGLTWVGGDDDPWEMVALFRQLHEMMDENPTLYGKLPSTLKGMEENLQAARLLNQGKPDSSLGFYYMQIPLRFYKGESAEVWIRYKWKEGVGRVVDLNDTRLEFSVKTEYLGDLYFTADISEGVIDVNVGVDDEEILAFVEAYLPVLEDRLNESGWITGNFVAQLRSSLDIEREDFISEQDFSSLEGVNVEI
ncbi:flagellar hook-length control protein FliK [bacterium]|nr:flagellar hook-length control protein FliK [bacterium]